MNLWVKEEVSEIFKFELDEEIVEYIVSVAESEDSDRNEKQEVISEFLKDSISGAEEEAILQFIEKLLEKEEELRENRKSITAMKDDAEEEDKISEEAEKYKNMSEDEIGALVQKDMASLRLNQQAIEERKNMDKTLQKKKEALIAKYGYDVICTEQEDGSILRKSVSEGQPDSGIGVNLNAQRVQEQEQIKRVQQKAQNEKKKQQEKEQREKEKLKKEKAKQRTQKQEKRRGHG